MTAKEIASALGCSERHARRLQAAHDPRIATLEQSGHSDISPDQWAQLERDLARDLEAEFPTPRRPKSVAEKPEGASVSQGLKPRPPSLKSAGAAPEGRRGRKSSRQGSAGPGQPEKAPENQ